MLYRAEKPKSVAPVSLAGFQPPAAGRSGNGSEKPIPIPVSTITMTYQHPMFSPRRRSPAHALVPGTLHALQLQRAAVAAQIETLIDWLDATDYDADLDVGDADVEDGHDYEQTDGRPVLIAACGRTVRL